MPTGAKSERPLRLVLDTNTIVSGILWSGAPGHVLALARGNDAELFTSPALVAELRDVLHRSKFRASLQLIGLSAEDVVEQYLDAAELVTPAPISGAAFDPDDDVVLACAVTAAADYIVSGDHHLLSLQEYAGIPIVRAAVLLSGLNQD